MISLQTQLAIVKPKRVMGIEPTLRAWEAPVLPLNYTRGEKAILGNFTKIANAQLIITHDEIGFFLMSA